MGTLTTFCGLQSSKMFLEFSFSFFFTPAKQTKHEQKQKTKQKIKRVAAYLQVKEHRLLAVVLVDALPRIPEIVKVDL